MTDRKTSERTAGGLVGKLVGRAKQAAAERKPRQPQARRESNKRQAAEATRRRRIAAERSAARTEKVIEERAKLERLGHLDAEADALEEKEAALRRSAASAGRRLQPEGGAQGRLTT
jgi:hypothetical protein